MNDCKDIKIYNIKDMSNIHDLKVSLNDRGIAVRGTKVAFFKRNTCRTPVTEEQGNGI